MQKLEVKLLGPPDIHLGNDPLRGFVTRKAQALLMYMAVTKGPHTRNSIASFFWRDVSDYQANNSLRRILPNLRKLVGAHLIIDRQELRFAQDSPFWIDVDAFESTLRAMRLSVQLPPVDLATLENTLELYRGDFLDGFYVRDAPAFEEWVLFQREHLRELAIHGLTQLADLYAQQEDFERGLVTTNRLLMLEPWYERAHGLQMLFLMQSGQRSAALVQYKVCQEMLADEFGAEPSAETHALYERIKAGDQHTSSNAHREPSRAPHPLASASTAAQQESRIPYADREEIPRPTSFSGREQELSQLIEWLTVDRCTLITILGTGGTGKTTLAAQVARQLVHSDGTVVASSSGSSAERPFARVIWRSLINAPPLSAMLRMWLRALSVEPLAGLPDTPAEQMMLLFDYLRQHRCLLILDNLESILKGEGYSGHLRTDYEEYGILFRRLGEMQHQSCLVLTSREMPLDLGRLTHDYAEVRSLSLAGLPTVPGVEVLRAGGLDDEPEQMAELVRRYSGNPLALKVVAETILELYGDIRTFLQGNTPIFDSIRTVLDEQFARLYPLEQEVLIWLAIEREPVSPQLLIQNWAHGPEMVKIVAALRSLQRRSLVDEYSPTQQSGSVVRFTLQNVVMEYITEQIVNTFCTEFATQVGTEDDAVETEFWLNSWLNRFALVKAQSVEHVRNTQARLILRPVVEHLLATWGREGALHHARRVLNELHAAPPRIPGYAAANLLHVLMHVKADLATWDFSQLAIRQADLRQTELINVQMAGADLTGSAFLDTFSAVLSVAFGANGAQLAAATTAGEITLWQSDTLQPQFVCQAGKGWIRSVVFSPQNDLFAAASVDHSIYLFDARTGHPIRTLQGHRGAVYDLAFSPNGRWLASAGMDHTVHLWDVERGKLGQILHYHSDFVMAVAFSPDGMLLASGGGDRVIRIWHLASKAECGQLAGHDAAVTALSFSPNGHTLVSGSADQTARLWDLEQMQPRQLFRGHSGEVESIAIHPQGRWLASGCQNGEIRLWDMATGQCKSTLAAHAATVWALSFSPDGQKLVSGSNDYTVRVWDTQARDVIQTLRGYNDQIWSIVHIPQTHTVVSASGSGQLRIWDTETGAPVRRWRAHDGTARALAVNRSGSLLASGGSDHVIRIWAVATGELRHTLTGHLQRIFSLGFIADGELLASSSNDGTIRLWQTRTGKLHQTVHAHAGRVSAIAFSPDGQRLASCGYDRKIYLWHLVDNYVVQPRALDDAIGFGYHVAFNPSGNLLAITSTTTPDVHLWDVETNSLFRTLRGQHTVSVDYAAFSPDGTQIATAGVDKIIYLWDVSTGQPIRCLAGHAAAVRALCWLDDNTLASCSGDETVRIWQTVRGECLHILYPTGPYAGLNIAGAMGISAAQRQALLALGAVETSSVPEATIVPIG